MTNNKKIVLRLADQDLKALRNVSEITSRSKSAVFRWALHAEEREFKQLPVLEGVA